jgi:hypothetical protein
VELPTRSQKTKLNWQKLARVGTALAHIRIGAERAGSTVPSLLISTIKTSTAAMQPQYFHADR